MPIRVLPRRRPHARSTTRERGSAALEFALLAPALLLLVFGGLQAALYFHAGSVAAAAAREGVREAAVENSTPDRGDAQARGYIADVAGDWLTNSDVHVVQTPTTVTVTVTGEALSIIPGLSPRVSKTAILPIERITR